MCWRSTEVDSARVRHLQSMLMVAAFKCPAYNFEAREIYNTFVRTHRSTLSNHNDVLKRHFMRAHGAIEGQRAYDRFTTTLANRDSDDSMAMLSDYCEAANMIGREAIETAPQDLILLANDLRSEPAGTHHRCDAGSPVIAAAPVAAPAIAVAAPPVNDPVLIAAVAPVPAAEPVQAEPAVLTTVAAAADTPEPEDAVPAVAEVAAVEAVPAPVLRKAAVERDADTASQADTAKALAAAAAALQEAAEALKAASNPIPDAAPVARTAVPGAR